MSIWSKIYPPEPPLYGWTRQGRPIRKLDTEPVDETLDQWLARFQGKIDAQRRRRAHAQAAAAPPKQPPLTEEEAEEALAAAQAHLRDAVAHPDAHSPPKPSKAPQNAKSPADLLAEWERQIAGWHKRRPRRQSKFL